MLVAGFGLLTFLQGPKLSSAIVDTVAVVAAPAQTLRMFVNEPVRAVRRSQVAIAPSAPFTVTSSGEGVVVQFTRALAYQTTYHVAIRAVTSADDGQSADLAYRFTTGSPEVYYLHRSGTSAPDQIVRTGIRTAGQDVVYQARGIQDFAVFDRAIAVTTESAGGASALAIVGDGGEVEQVDLPGAGVIGELHANRDTGLLGFTFTSAGPTAKRRYSDTLFTVDPSGTGIPTVVKDPAGRSLRVLAFDYVPATSELVAQLADERIVLVDTSRRNAVSFLGTYSGFDGIAADGSAVVVSNGGAPLSLALPSGKASRLAVSPFMGSAPQLGPDVVLVPGGRIQDDQVLSASTGRLASQLVFDNGRATRKLLAIADGTIDGIGASPNSEFAVVETTPDAAAARPDGYRINGRARGETTDFVDVASGLLVKSVVGFDVQFR